MIAGLVIAAIIILMVENWRRVERCAHRFDWASDLLFAGLLAFGAATQWSLGHSGVALILSLSTAIHLVAGLYNLRRRRRTI